MLFSSSRGEEDEVLYNMVLILTRLPEPYWSHWTNRKLYFDEDGKWVGDNRKLSTNARTFLRIGSSAMDAEERSMFEDLLRKMVVYDLEERIKIYEVVASPWFVKYRRDKL